MNRLYKAYLERRLQRINEGLNKVNKIYNQCIDMLNERPSMYIFDLAVYSLIKHDSLVGKHKNLVRKLNQN